MTHFWKHLIVVSALMFALNAMALPIFDWQTGSPVSGEYISPTRTLQSDGGGFTVTYSFPTYRVEKDNESDALRFYLEDFGTSQDPVEAALPCRIDFFHAPDCNAATMEILSVDFTEYDCVIAHGYGNVSGYNQDMPVTTSEATFDNLPQQFVSLDKRFTYRGEDCIGITVNPILYDQELRRIKVCSSITFAVSYNMPMRVLSRGNTDSSEGEADIEFNFSSVLSLPCEPKPDAAIERNSSMLIISPSCFEDALSSFIEWKRMLGIDAQAVYSDSWTEEDIDNAIASFYNSHPNLKYLLFVGDNEKVPGKYFKTFGNALKDSNYMDGIESLYATTDYGYATQSNYSVQPLFYYGRIPASNEAQLSIVLNKIIKYEKTPIEDYSFYTQGVHMAYIDTNEGKGMGNPDCDQAAFVPASEEIERHLKSYDKEIEKLYSCRKVYPENSDWFSGTKYWHSIWYHKEPIPDSLRMDDASYWRHGHYDFMNSINDGRFYAMYLGHGFVERFYNNSWTSQGDALTAEQAYTLTNGDKLPVLFSMSCETGNFVYDSLAKAFLTNPNGGAVGCIAASAESTKGPNEIMAMYMIHSIWNDLEFKTKLGAISSILPYDGQYNDDRLRLGSILHVGVTKMVGLRAAIMNKTFHCLGDPSMKMRTDYPAQIGKTTYSCDGDSILTVTTYSKNATIAFYDKNTGEVSCWLGGRASFHYNKKSNITVTVHADNSIPYTIKPLLYFSLGPIPDPNPYPAYPTLISCQSPNNSQIDVTYDSGDFASQISISAVNMLTGEETSVDCHEEGEAVVTIPVNGGGNFGILLKCENTILETKKINVR